MASRFEFLTALVNSNDRLPRSATEIATCVPLCSLEILRHSICLNIPNSLRKALAKIYRSSIFEVFANVAQPLSKLVCARLDPAVRYTKLANLCEHTLYSTCPVDWLLPSEIEYPLKGITQNAAWEIPGNFHDDSVLAN